MDTRPHGVQLIVLLSTHVVEDVAACERVLVLARGRLLFDGEPRALADVARGRVWELRSARRSRGAPARHRAS